MTDAIAAELERLVVCELCEACQQPNPIELMTMMGEYWFCAACTLEFRKQFDSCRHQWSSHVDEMGDAGKYCPRCSGFVPDDVFPILFDVVWC